VLLPTPTLHASAIEWTHGRNRSSIACDVFAGRGTARSPDVITGLVFFGLFALTLVVDRIARKA
jgi:hypothetical protein